MADCTLLLPPEIWLQIFEDAVSAFPEPLASYAPFQAQTILSITLAGKSDDLSTARVLTTVCHFWRSLSLHLLYKEILVLRGIRGLHSALKGSRSELGHYGDAVKRIAVPYQCTAGPSAMVASCLEILRLCRKVEVLARPHMRNEIGHFLSFDYGAEAVSFPSLSRLEWWYDSDAERSGGVNSLVSVLQSAPNLRYLFVAGVTDTGYMDKSIVTLPKLESLRLCMANPLFARLIVRGWSLPSLTKVILDTPLPSHNVVDFFEAVGFNLRVLELGKHFHFAVANCVPSCLLSCPNLEEFNYYVFYTAAPYPTHKTSDLSPYPRLSTVGLHAATNPMIGKAQAWEILERHMSFLASADMGELKRVVLHGDWKKLLGDSAFQPLKHMILQAGRRLEV